MPIRSSLQQQLIGPNRKLDAVYGALFSATKILVGEGQSLPSFLATATQRRKEHLRWGLLGQLPSSMEAGRRTALHIELFLRVHVHFYHSFLEKGAFSNVVESLVQEIFSGASPPDHIAVI